MGQVEEFFLSNPTQLITGVQPNPHGLGWVGFGPMGWIVFFLITIIVIKLKIRTTPLQIRTNL